MSTFTGQAGEAPLLRTIRARHDTDAAAGTDYTEVVGTAPFAGTISAVSYIPDAAVSGATSTATTLAVRNETQNLAAAALAFITGVDLVAFTAKALTLSGTAANLVVAAGDVITFKKTHASTGTAMSSGSVEVVFSRNDIL